MIEPRFDTLPARADSGHRRPIYMVGDQTAKFIASQGFFMPQGEWARPPASGAPRPRRLAIVKKLCYPPLAVIASRIVSGVARREEEIP
jgi:hypothetical protein